MGQSQSLIKDKQTVSADGKMIVEPIEGVFLKSSITHVDHRGTVCVMMDPRWQEIEEPMVYSYFITTRPGKIKGWGMHKTYSDRYFIMQGDIELVLYDGRTDSPTYNTVSKYGLSEKNRTMVYIPPGVWHIHRNIGATDALIANFPTKPYNHKNPDKFRLPHDTDQIPFQFSSGG